MIVTKPEDFASEKPYTYFYTLNPIFYLLIIGYSFFVSYLTGTHLIVNLLIYKGISLCRYFWHYQAHVRIWFIPYNEDCIKIHDRHHKKYTEDHFYGDGTDKGEDLLYRSLPFMTPFRHEAFLYIQYTIFFSFLAIIGFSKLNILLYIILTLLLTIYNNYMHIAFHIYNFWLDKYKFFRELRAIHYLHHVLDFTQNYGMGNLDLDILFKTYYDNHEYLMESRSSKSVKTFKPFQ